MNLFKQRSIRWGLVWRFLANAAIPLLVFGLLLREYLTHRERDFFEHHNNLVTRAIAQAVKVRLIQSESLLRQILLLESANNPVKEIYLDRLVENGQKFEAAYYVDSRGFVQMIGLPPSLRSRRSDFLGLDLSQMPLIQTALKENRILWSDAYLSLISGKLSLTLCIPMADGILVANVGLEQMQNLVQEINVEKTLKTLILDRQGVILFGADGKRTQKKVSLLNESLVQTALQSKSSNGSFQLEGARYHGSATIIPEVGWIVLAFQTEKDFFDLISKMRLLLSLGIVVSVVFALGIAIAMSRRLARPLQQFETAAQSISKGHFETPVPHQTYREFDSLSKSIQGMALEIKERQKQIQTLARKLVSVTGIECYDLVAREACRVFKADIAIIGRIFDQNKIETVVFLKNNALSENFVYSLENTPCEKALQDSVCIYGTDVQSVFPNDSDLKKHQINGYIGASLSDSKGKKLGVLVVMSHKPLPITSDAADIIKIFSHRVSVEMEREQVETEKRAMEAELLQSQKMEAVGRLAGGVAHDFNNLLHSIMGFISLALEDIKPQSEAHENLTEARNAAKRTSELVKQLLTFSRRDSVRPQVFDLNKIVMDSLKLLKPLLGEHISLNFTRSSEELPIFADPNQIEQVILNLSVNARDAMPDGGSLKISLARITNVTTGGGSSSAVPMAELRISDTGSGMTSETCEKIFDPFFTTKSPGKGTGLGLSIVYAIVSRLSGSISVFSELKKGTVFIIRLPLFLQTITTVQEDIEQPSWSAATAPMIILLAEDDPLVCRLATHTLENAGHKVLTAQDGEKAIQVFEENKSQLGFAILDGIMPLRNGKDVAIHILKTCPQLPILFCSGYSHGMLNLDGLPNGNIGFLNKPFSAVELLRTMELMRTKRTIANQ